MTDDRQTPKMPDVVAAAFEAFPDLPRGRLLEVRRLIFAIAAANQAIGPLTETLKWGEPAYLTEATKSGSTIRLGWKATAPDDCAILFNCRTTLVESFEAQFPGVFRVQGTRAILLHVAGPLPDPPLGECLDMALTYHQRARTRAKNTASQS